MAWCNNCIQSMEMPKSFNMGTFLIHAKLLQQWPLSNRDFCNAYLGLMDEEHGFFFLVGKSVVDPLAPEKPGIMRLPVGLSAFICKSINNGEGCRFTHISEMEFGGKIPKSLVLRGGAQSFCDAIKKLKKILAS